VAEVDNDGEEKGEIDQPALPNTINTHELIASGTRGARLAINVALLA